MTVILLRVLVACASKETYWQLPPGVDVRQAERDESECKRDAAMVNQAPWPRRIEEYREELVQKCMKSRGYTRE